MARENSCLSRIAAVGDALGGVVGKLFSPFHFPFPLCRFLGAGLMNLRYLGQPTICSSAAVFGLFVFLVAGRYIHC
ncbi:hypothetical protein Bca101_090024 [Brassica carinata]